MTVPSRIDHVAMGIAMLPSKLRVRTNWQKLITAMLTRANELEGVFLDIITKKYLANAVGAQLDDIGGIVGRERQGMDDDTYRLWLYAQILLLKKSGSIPDIIAVFKAVNVGTSLTFSVSEFFPRSLIVRSSGPVSLPEQQGSMLQKAKAGGINAQLIAPPTRELSNSFTWGDSNRNGGVPETSDLLGWSDSRYSGFDTWTVTQNGGATAINNLIFANGTFVAVGYGTTNAIFTSTNGYTWTQHTSHANLTSDPLYALAYGASLFVAMGAGSELLTSPDGATWTSHAPTFTPNTIRKLRFLNNTLFFALGDVAVVGTSTNGTSFTDRTSAVNFSFSTQASAAAYGAGVYIVTNLTGELKSSTNGTTTWTTRTSTFGTTAINEAVFGGGVFVIVGDSGKIASSTNGTSWTARTSGTSENLLGVIHDGSKFIAWGVNGAVTVSDDGTSWTKTTYADWAFSAAASDGTNVALGASDPQIYTSEDDGETFSQLDDSPLASDPIVAAATDGAGIFVMATSTAKLVTSGVSSAKPGGYWVSSY